MGFGSGEFTPTKYTKKMYIFNGRIRIPSEYPNQKLIVAILLGFFAGKKWDGSYESNGTIVVKENGDLVTFHIIDIDSLKDYLFENIKLDTPSSSRHKFGTIIQDKANNYFKLNLQLRF